MKKIVSVMFASLLLASCNGEDNNTEVDETEDSSEVEETEEVNQEEESEDEASDDSEEELDESDETDEADESTETEEDEGSSDVTHDFDGNSYYLNIQYQGILDPFGTLIFEDDAVTLEQNDTFEGEYTLEDNVMDIQVSNEDMSYHIVLDINPSDSEIVVDGTVETYEIEGGDFSDEEQEVIDALAGNNFMMTRQ